MPPHFSWPGLQVFSPSVPSIPSAGATLHTHENLAGISSCFLFSIGRNTKHQGEDTLGNRRTIVCPRILIKLRPRFARVTNSRIIIPLVYIPRLEPSVGRRGGFLCSSTKNASGVGALHGARAVGLALRDEGQRHGVDAVPLVRLRVAESFTSEYVPQVPWR